MQHALSELKPKHQRTAVYIETLGTEPESQENTQENTAPSVTNARNISTENGSAGNTQNEGKTAKPTLVGRLRNPNANPLLKARRGTVASQSGAATFPPSTPLGATATATAASQPRPGLRNRYELLKGSALIQKWSTQILPGLVNAHAGLLNPGEESSARARADKDTRASDREAGQGVSWAAFSACDEYLATRSDATPRVLWIWALKSLSLIAMLVQDQPIKFASWDPAGCRLAIVTASSSTVSSTERGSVDKSERQPAAAGFQYIST